MHEHSLTTPPSSSPPRPSPDADTEASPGLRHEGVGAQRGHFVVAWKWKAPSTHPRRGGRAPQEDGGSRGGECAPAPLPRRGSPSPVPASLPFQACEILESEALRQRADQQEPGQGQGRETAGRQEGRSQGWGVLRVVTQVALTVPDTGVRSNLPARLTQVNFSACQSSLNRADRGGGGRGRSVQSRSGQHPLSG